MYLKSLKLQNYCNYKNILLDFTREDGTPYPFVCFYGPNGSGKSSLLEAIALLTTPQTGRPKAFIQNSLAKFVRNTDYDPTYNKLLGQQYKDSFIVGEQDSSDTKMVIEGTYILDNRPYVVRVTNNGWERDDFAPIPPADLDDDEKLEILNSGPWGKDHLRYRQRISHFLSIDNDLSMSKFQLITKYAEQFEKIISQITRFHAECVMPSTMNENRRSREFITDFVLLKNGHRIHFKRMSAGERKICKAFSSLLNLMHSLEHPISEEPPLVGWPPILLFDNIVMHVYYDRHITMIECLKEIFFKQQIFATTHSGVLIPRAIQGKNDTYSELWIDLEKINGKFEEIAH